MTLINIAIDGPAGAGKSTVARRVAEEMGSNYRYVDTGAIYRSLTYYFLQEKIDLDLERELNKSMDEIDISLNEEGYPILNGQLLTDEIRSLAVTKNVSLVSSYSCVRTFVYKFLQKIGEAGGVVMDGRDIGTVVLPDAHVKIFLTASLTTRAQRRALEMQGKGISIDVQDIEEDIARRDLYDSSREISPLKQAEDAILLDSSDLTIEEVVGQIVKICQQKITQ